MASGTASTSLPLETYDRADIPLIDTHIHLDSYSLADQESIASALAIGNVQYIITVSMNLPSCKRNLELSRIYGDSIKPAFGYHPEQPLPSPDETEELLRWMENHVQDMVAVGEVGLPYYARLEAESAGHSWDNAPYIELLERFVAFAKKHDKPIILHAVYEDADTSCDLLEAYGIARAHFHWFKGSRDTLDRMAASGYHISFTPDILYEEEIRDIARMYPPQLVMTETDGPWPFEGPLQGQTTRPEMTALAAAAWAELQGISEQEARRQLYRNAARLYGL
ncbi:TatD family hydrolase [Paenibacillus sp. FSL W8-0919]|uniref:TatD family hydrolase n=1 Tax=Paenibacillus sp. FSL W8-0919 TaxID=2954707 RepID=UPI0030F74396